MDRNNISENVRSQLLDIEDSLRFVSYLKLTNDTRSSLRSNLHFELNEVYNNIDTLQEIINHWIITPERPIDLVNFETQYRKFVSSEYEVYKVIVNILDYTTEKDIELLWEIYKMLYSASSLEDYKNSRPYNIMRDCILGSTGMKEYDAFSDTIKSLETLGDVVDPK